MVVYRQCLDKHGREKLTCLIEAIISDYEHGYIDKSTAAARLRYLIALNRANGWVSNEEAVKAVAYALKRINAVPKRGELRRVIARELYA